MRQLTYLLKDELLVLWGRFLTEMHDENIRSCLHSYAGLWLVGVIANFTLGCVLKKLKMEQPTGVSYPPMWREGTHWMRTWGYKSTEAGVSHFPLTHQQWTDQLASCMSTQHSAHPGVALSECKQRDPFLCPPRLLDSESRAGAWVTPCPLCLALCWCRSAGKKCARPRASTWELSVTATSQLPPLFFSPFLLLFHKHSECHRALERIKLSAPASNTAASGRPWFFQNNGFPPLVCLGKIPTPVPSQRGKEDSFSLRRGPGNCSFTLLTRRSATYPPCPTPSLPGDSDTGGCS